MKQNRIIALIFALTGIPIAANNFTVQDQKKAFAKIQDQVRSVQIDVHQLLDKIKNSLIHKTPTVKAADVTKVLKLIQQAIASIEGFVAKAHQSRIKDQETIAQLNQLVKNVFMLGKETNIMTELQESVSLLMGPLQNQEYPVMSMREYLQCNFEDTGIDLDTNIYIQVGLPEKPHHDLVMKRYRMIVTDPHESEQKKFVWRQIQYFMRQPIGMLMYDLWLQDKKGFYAVFSKLPKSELGHLFQYLNLGYRQKVCELVDLTKN